jgi:hypothetical protein
MNSPRVNWRIWGIALVLTLVTAAVFVGISARAPRPVELRVIRQARQGPTNIIVFRLTSKDREPLRLAGIGCLVTGPFRFENAMTTNFPSLFPFSGQTDFGVFTLNTNRVWRYQVTLWRAETNPLTQVAKRLKMLGYAVIELKLSFPRFVSILSAWIPSDRWWEQAVSDPVSNLADTSLTLFPPSAE